MMMMMMMFITELPYTDYSKGNKLHLTYKMQEKQGGEVCELTGEL